MAQRTQREVAHQVGVGIAMMNDVTAGRRGLVLPRLEAFLTALGLRVVADDDDSAPDLVCIPRDELDALRTLARRALEIDTHG